jgi:hypothetical protein
MTIFSAQLQEKFGLDEVLVILKAFFYTFPDYR